LRIALILSLCLATSACLPGLPGFGADEVGEASLAPTDGPSGAVTRSGKTGFLSGLQPSAAVPARDVPAPTSGWAAQPARGAQPQAVALAVAPEPDEPRAVEAPIAPPAVALGNFYAALASLANGQRTDPVTVLHLGDDHIALDQFTSDLRAQFQSRFGDAGRGLLPPGVFPAQGVKFDRGGAWTLRNSAGGDDGLYGITGLRLETSALDAWVRLNHLRGNFDTLDITFATAPASGTAVVSIDGEPKLIPTSDDRPGRTSIRVSGQAREVVVRPRGDGPIALLSVSIGMERPGVRYINLGLPGATAATPGKWNTQFVAADLAAVRPDLIVLSYGTQEGFIDKLDLREYELRVNLLVQQLRELAPQSSFLLLGPPDAARLPAFAAGRGGQACRGLSAREISQYRRMMKSEDRTLARWHAPPMLDGVRTTLRSVASAQDAYFWDWSKMMGGPCSIHAWVHATPPLAAPDHMTLTPAGAERAARALFIELMNGYEAFRQTQPAPLAKAAPGAGAKPARAAQKPERQRAN
jgi:hypothetical protein